MNVNANVFRFSGTTHTPTISPRRPLHLSKTKWSALLNVSGVNSSLDRRDPAFLKTPPIAELAVTDSKTPRVVPPLSPSAATSLLQQAPIIAARQGFGNQSKLIRCVWLTSSNVTVFTNIITNNYDILETTCALQW